MAMEDIRDEAVNIKISDDGKKVWINTPSHCVFRAQNIPELHIDDSRVKKSEFISISQRAGWAFMLMIGGGFVFSYLFPLLGLESVHGALIGAFVGLISGYFYGRSIDKREQK